MKREFFSSSYDDTINIAKEFAKEIKPGSVILLNGDLGAGKTVFVKGICDYFNVKSRVVSPTYTIVNEYQGDLPIYHFDIYRLNDEEELINIGFDDYFDDDAVILVEWSDNIPEAFYGMDFTRIDFLLIADNDTVKRKITIS